ncbi:MAG: sugar transferase [Candidatus Komeilibacteria bacterium]
MKKFELISNAILVPLDYLVLLAAAITSYFLRFESFITDFRPVIFNMSLAEFINIAYLILLAWILIFALSGLYSFSRRTLWQEIRLVFFGCSTATMIIILAFFFDAQLFSSRFIILAVWALSIIFVVIERLIVYLIKKLFYQHGYGVKRVVIIGQDNNTLNLIAEFKKHPSYGFRVIEHLNKFTDKESNYLDQLRSKLIIDVVIQADIALPQDQKEALFNYCQQHQLGFKYIASLLETKLSNFDISTLSGVPVVEIRHTRLQGWGRIGKRTYDLILSIVGCLVMIPITLIVGLIIKVDSPGPIFVKLKRIGYRGEVFSLYKFRSMVDRADSMKKQIIAHNERQDGPLFKMKNDPRITRVGKVLRQTSIDELPQLFNVLFGTMSMVGPRPHEPEEVAQYQRHHLKLFNIKPGITGMAQVSGRSNLLFEEEVRLDTYYLENWSFWLDIQIILKTFVVVVLGKDVA